MKSLRLLIIGLSLGGVLGWAFGYLRIPYVDHTLAFWVGVGVAIAAGVLGIALLFVTNNREALSRLMGKKSASPRYLRASVLFALCLILGAIAGGVALYQQHGKHARQVADLRQQVLAQANLIDSLRAGEQVTLMSEVLDKVDRELEQRPQRTLSDGTIARIVALSAYLKPYRNTEGDSLSQEKLSPERGQLLLALCALDIDSTSFARIKREATFASADLRRANLQGADLSQINLQEANLRDAQLQGANLRASDLRKANFWGADLSRAVLSKANMKRANMQWALLKEADMHEALLDGAFLNNAQLTEAALQEISFYFTDLSGSLLNGADLEGGNLYGATLVKTNFSNANLRNVRLHDANFHQTLLTGAELSDAEVRTYWLDSLNSWQVQGAPEIQQRYLILQDTVKDEGRYKIRLKKKR